MTTVKMMRLRSVTERMKMIPWLGFRRADTVVCRNTSSSLQESPALGASGLSPAEIQEIVPSAHTDPIDPLVLGLYNASSENVEESVARKGPRRRVARDHASSPCGQDEDR